MTKVLSPILSKSIEKVSVSLSLEDERRLIPLAQQGNLNARNTLLNTQLKQIVSISRSYANNLNSVSELVSDAVLGFDYAINKFDLTMNVRFVTYYRNWVRDYVNRSVYSNRTIRPPMNIAKTNSKTDEELNNISNNKRKSTDKVHVGVSMDTPISNTAGGSTTTYGEYFRSDDCVETNVMIKLDNAALHKALNTLDKNSKEWKYVKLHYMNHLSITDIGKMFDVSKQSVSANILKSMSRLRKKLKHHM